MSKKITKKENKKEAQEQIEVQEQIEEKEIVLVEVSLKMLEDGRITLNVNETKDDEPITIATLESILKQAYDTVHDDRIVQMALDAFKQRLG